MPHSLLVVHQKVEVLRASPLFLHLHPHVHFNIRSADADVGKPSTHQRKCQTRMEFCCVKGFEIPFLSIRRWQELLWLTFDRQQEPHGLFAKTSIN